MEKNREVVSLHGLSCYKGCVGYYLSLLVTWMFPQVLLNGGNPLNALNQFVNSEMFIVFHRHHLFPNFLSFYLVRGTDLNPPRGRKCAILLPMRLFLTN